MPAIRHILFPFDFSKRCHGAAPFVRAMANRFSAKITIVSVAQPFWITGAGNPPPPALIDTCKDERGVNRQNRIVFRVCSLFAINKFSAKPNTY